MARIKKDPKFEGVHEWFADWLDHHITLFGDKPYWPQPGSQQFEVVFGNWKDRFIKKGLHDKDIAYEISGEMSEAPPAGLEQHLPAILTLAARIYRERNVAAKGDGDPLVAIKEASRDCEHCAGNGFATVWHPQPREVREGYAEYSTSAYCVCKYGVWLMNYYRVKPVEGAGKVVNLADVLEGRTWWLLKKPGYDELPEFQGRHLRGLVAQLAGKLPDASAPRQFVNPPPGSQGRLPSLPDRDPAAY